jgi:DNA-binding HxlR family transcriptional regulator
VTIDLHDIDDDECRRFQTSVELVGRRWNSAILLAVARGSERFGDIVAAVPGLSDRLLAQRVKELETAGLLQRQVIASMPVQVRYRLTDRGGDLMRSLQPLVAWGQRWEIAPRSTASERQAPSATESSSGAVV